MLARGQTVRHSSGCAYRRGTHKGIVNQWFWKGPGEEWSKERRKSLPTKLDGHFHVYWTYIPASEAEGAISGMRFDPINAMTPSTIAWVAIDEVPTPQTSNPRRLVLARNEYPPNSH
jgi:hypothetical protein